MENETQAPRRHGSLGRKVAAGLAVLVIAFCAWSMSQYVQGRDPLAWLPGAQHAAGTVDEKVHTASEGTDAPTQDAAQGGESEALATVSADDVTKALTRLSWQGEDVSLKRDDATVVLTKEGIWVEHRGSLPADETVRLSAARLAALMQWAQSSGVSISQVTWIEEDLTGTVRLAATLDQPVMGNDVLASCSGYAISGDAYAALAEGRPGRTAGKRPVLPDGKKVPVKTKRTSEGEVLSQDRADEVLSTEHLVSESVPEGGGDAQASDSTAPSSQMVVSVTVDASSVGAGSSSAQVALEPGATAFDALQATGVSIGTRGFGGGAWVTSIGGVAEDASHGWTYTVDGAMPSTMSDRCEVYDGSSVVWTFVATN